MVIVFSAVHTTLHRGDTRISMARFVQIVQCGVTCGVRERYSCGLPLLKLILLLLEDIYEGLILCPPSTCG